MINKLKQISGAPAFAAAALLMMFTVPAAFGQEIIKSDVPFAFKVGSKTLPAGTYNFQIHRTDDYVSVENAIKVKAASAVEPIMTSLSAETNAAAKDAHLVFDKVGNTYTLSELWEPNMEGVLVHATKGKHEHHVIHAKK